MSVIKLKTHKEQKNIATSPIEIPFTLKKDKKGVIGKFEYKGSLISNKNLYRIVWLVKLLLKDFKGENINDIFNELSSEIDKILVPDDWLVQYEILEKED